MDRASQDRFVESWGLMGSAWGVSASVARVHALLIVADEPLSLDEIARRLDISRGNASMSLRELRSWGVVRLVKQARDRRDYYVTEPDVWKMLFAIARERKRREFDPLLAAVRQSLAGQRGGSGPVEQRLAQMEQLIGTMSAVAERVLGDEEQGRALLAFLMGAAAAPRG